MKCPTSYLWGPCGRGGSIGFVKVLPPYNSPSEPRAKPCQLQNSVNVIEMNSSCRSWPWKFMFQFPWMASQLATKKLRWETWAGHSQEGRRLDQQGCDSNRSYSSWSGRWLWRQVYGWKKFSPKPALKLECHDHCLGIRTEVQDITSFLGLISCQIEIRKGSWIVHLDHPIL